MDSKPYVDTNAIIKLKSKIIICQTSATNAVEGVSRYMTESLAAIVEKEKSLVRGKKSAYERYKMLKQAYYDCKDSVGPANCGFEREAKDEAFREMKEAEELLRRGKRIARKVKQMKKELDVILRDISSEYGRHTEDGIIYLNKVIEGVLDYDSIVLPKSTQYSTHTHSEDEKRQCGKFDSDYQKSFTIGEFTLGGGKKFEIKNRIVKGGRGKVKQTSYTLYEKGDTVKPIGSFTVVGQNGKEAILSDFQVPSKNELSWGTNKGNLLRELERTAKKSGCTVMKGWVEKKDLELYEQCGYEIAGFGDDDIGFEISKKL